MILLKYLSPLFVFLGATTALALDGPRPFIDHSSSFSGRSLGAGCYAFELSSDHLFCNPAFIAKERGPQFSSHFFLGQNFKKISDISSVVNGTANRENVQNLFNERNSSEIESTLELSYVTSKWGLSLAPMQIKYFSAFQNSALPEVHVFASKTESVNGQLGTYLGDDFFLGLQLDFEQTQFISSRFFLTDAFTEEASEIIKPQSESNIFITPGLLYSPEDSNKPYELGFTLSRYKITNTQSKKIPSLSQFHLSGAYHWDLDYGLLGLGADWAWDPEFVQWQDTVTASAFYQFGILKLMAHVSALSKGLGLLVHHDSLSAGVTYSDRIYFDDTPEKENSRNIYLVLRVQI